LSIRPLVQKYCYQTSRLNKLCSGWLIEDDWKHSTASSKNKQKKSWQSSKILKENIQRISGAIQEMSSTTLDAPTNSNTGITQSD
jgi:hypothetical protein